ncbi:hypothetical protein GH714_015721 [Hevea brasiliensis]|uniref:Uncharacterized protein n=1 Tax=Hevea brasiliensis TaxID=3981 RepID=A0A6A6M1L1_HEVBR|nr:hypothetical protein GH714_015721 [Hevea brasiliensis]
MQAKKAKQLLKARLWCERQIYEMQKRAELKVAVAELERPWEVVEKAPTLFSVSADGQVKVLADRFQKPGGAVARNGCKTNGMSINGKFRRGDLYTGRKKDDVDSLAMEVSSDSESG